MNRPSRIEIEKSVRSRTDHDFNPTRPKRLWKNNTRTQRQARVLGGDLSGIKKKKSSKNKSKSSEIERKKEKRRKEIKKE